MDLMGEVLESTATTITVCNLLSVRVGRIITNPTAQQFKVTEVNGKVITLESVGHIDPWSGETFTIEDPTFLQGNQMMANEEFMNISNNTFNKTPLIWLVRGYTENHKGLGSNIDYDVSVVVYFLEETPSDGWLTSEHDTNAINPMYNLCERFMDTVKNSPKLNEITDYSITDKPKFGVKVGDKGSSKLILDDYLSGVELRFSMEVTDSCINC
jgi:hypothetical protein